MLITFCALLRITEVLLLNELGLLVRFTFSKEISTICYSKVTKPYNATFS